MTHTGTGRSVETENESVARAFQPPMRALLALLVLLPSTARADVRAVLVAGPAGAVASDAPVQARLGEPVEVRVALVDGREVLADVPARVGRRSRHVGPLPAGIRVEWRRVEPERVHVRTPSPNPGLDSFSNAVLTGPDHGAWLGLDPLEYREQPLGGPDVEIDGALARVSAAHPTDPRLDRNGGAGTMWIAARVTLADGTVLDTAGAGDVDRFGLSAEVMRVSFRTGDDYLGWLATYFNVPFVFGSMSTQVERYTGTDCADALIGGRRREGREVPYVSVAGLSRVASPRSEARVLDDEGHLPGEPLVWGDDVQPGDLVTIDYLGPGDDAALPRPWDHIGALVADDGDGVLDGDDVLRHMGMLGLVDEPLRDHGRIRLRVHRFR